MAATSRAGKTGTIVVSALRARANFEKLLRRVDDQSGSLVIEKRRIPRPVLLIIRDYVKLAAPADYLVAGNLKHFPRFWKKTKVVTPRELVSLAAPPLVR